MSKREEALKILKDLGLPKRQQNERSCLTLLALAGLAEEDSWANVKRPLSRILDLMNWMKEKYGKSYAANSRETIRRMTVHQFEQARLIDRNPDNLGRPTNSGETRYQLTEDAAGVLQSCGAPDFSQKCEKFIERHGSLAAAYEQARKLQRIPVKLLDGSRVELSPGIHNELQRLIVEEFAARFAPGSIVLYLGDTAKKQLVVATSTLIELNVSAINHGKLPDVVLYDKPRNWLFLIEAVATHGPVSPKRRAELEALLKDCPAGRVDVTAFMNFAAFKKYASEIVWESDVWIAEFPDHMIHFNGDNFLGPHPPRLDGEVKESTQLSPPR